MQVALPRIAAGRVHAQLTRGGGLAEVTIGAFPATRLLRNGGDRIEVRGQRLEIGLSGGAEGAPAGLATLDGFREVDVELVRFRAGPFAVSAFVLTRSSGGTYAMAAEARISSAELARLGAARLRTPAGRRAPRGRRPRRLARLTRRPRLDPGRALERGERPARAQRRGTIAGYPAGPIATAIAAAVARRLEITP